MKVDVDNIAFTYPTGITALQRVSLQVNSGERVAIIGQNGAGKTTLVKHLNGMLRPTRGKILLDGLDIAGRSIAALSAHVGYVFQNPDEQIFAKTVAADVMFGPRNLSFAPAAAQEAVRAALAAVELDWASQLHPHDLSWSDRKKVAIASVLAMRTPIVVWDEPTTGQDARAIALLARLVHDLAASGKTVIAVTHDMDFCAENFTRIVLMTKGQIVADGPAQEVFALVNELREAHVEPPQLMRLARQLGLATLPCTPDEFLAALAENKP